MADEISMGLKRSSPLDGVIRPGLYGAASKAGPGVKLAQRHDMSIVNIIARKGKTNAVSQTMQKHYGVPCPAPGYCATGHGLNLRWSGADQWYAIASERQDGRLYEELAGQLAGLASLSDHSHGRIILSISGPHASDVLAKGTPVDLHARVFDVGRCAVTQIAHIGVHISRTGPDAFELSLFRGFAGSFWDWLTLMSQEFGYEVRAFPEKWEPVFR